MEKVNDFKRRILLMDYPGRKGDNNYVEFTHDIIGEYEKFFKSDIGGCWGNSEITYRNLIELSDAKKVIMEDLNDLKQCAYSIVVFVGHGCCDKGIDKIQLGQDVLFPVNDLYRNAGKRLVIVDSCRTPLPQQYVPSFTNIILESKSVNREKNKEHYNNIISGMTNHVEVIQSTQIGKEAATISAQKTSVFSMALFDALKIRAHHKILRYREFIEDINPKYLSYNNIKDLVNDKMNNNQKADYTYISENDKGEKECISSPSPEECFPLVAVHNG